MIKVIGQGEIESLRKGELFFVRKDSNVFGLFKKKRSKFSLVSKSLLSLGLSIFPEEVDDRFIVSTLMFKYRRDSRSAFLRVLKDGDFLDFYFLLFDGNGIVKIRESKLFGREIESVILNLRDNNPYYLSKREVFSLIEGLVPQSILNNIRNRVSVLFVEAEENVDFLPFEILFSKFDVVVNRVLPSNVTSYSKKRVNTLGIFSNGWDDRFGNTLSEGMKVFEMAKKVFKKVDFVSHKIELSEFVQFMENDVVYFSSHADGEGIDLGNVKVNERSLALINVSPKVVIFNSCYFDGLVEVVKSLISKGANYVIVPFSKIPDSDFTSAFVEDFFFVFSRTFDVNLAMFVASKISDSRKLYNHLLYRIYVPMRVG